MGERSWLRLRGKGNEIARRGDPSGPNSRKPSGNRRYESEVLATKTSFEVGQGLNRDQCWEQLGRAVQERINQETGPALGWAATMVDRGLGLGQSPAVAVFGRYAAVFADPVVRFSEREGHVRAYRISRYEFDPATLLNAEVDHRPRRSRVRRTSSPSPDSAADPRDVPGSRVPGVSNPVGDAVASMPARARELLERPFLANNEKALRSDRYWHGHDVSHLSAVVVMIASDRRATLAVGQRVIPVGHSAATAHWMLTCWHAEVVRRVGK